MVEIEARIKHMREQGRERMIPAAMVCATLANIHRDKKQRKYNVKDFLPKADREPGKRMSVAQMNKWVDGLKIMGFAQPKGSQPAITQRRPRT